MLDYHTQQGNKADQLGSLGLFAAWAIVGIGKESLTGRKRDSLEMNMSE